MDALRVLPSINLKEFESEFKKLSNKQGNLVQITLTNGISLIGLLGRFLNKTEYPDMLPAFKITDQCIKWLRNENIANEVLRVFEAHQKVGLSFFGTKIFSKSMAYFDSIFDLSKMFPKILSNTYVSWELLELNLGEENGYCFIPVELIAGIREISWKSEMIQSEEKTNYSFNMYDDNGLETSLDWSYQRVQSIKDRLFFRISGMAHMPIRVGKPYKWGRIDFTNFEPMYCDWDYLSSNSGGLKGLGFSTPVGGISASYEKSLWTIFLERIKKVKLCTPMNLKSHLGSDDLVAIKGTVSFFKPEIFHEMENGEWELGAFTEEWHDNRK